MHIRLALRPGDAALADRLAADPVLARALGPKKNAAVGWVFPKWFDAQGDVLPRVLDAAAGCEVSFLRDVAFHVHEITAAPLLEALPRVTVRQTRAEAERTRQAYLAEPLRPTVGRWAVRRPSSLWLSGPVRDDTIAHVDQWTGEHVVGTGIAAGLRDAGVRGGRLLEVQRVRGGARDDAFHLTSDETLGASHFDESAHVDAGGTPRRLGALVVPPDVAAAAQQQADLLRTAEPWGPWETPAWIVSASVRHLFEASSWRGWAFRPVLIAGSAAHETHLTLWARVQRLLAAHGRATIPI